MYSDVGALVGEGGGGGGGIGDAIGNDVMISETT